MASQPQWLTVDEGWGRMQRVVFGQTEAVPADWLSSAVENTWLFLVGIVVLRSMMRELSHTVMDERDATIFRAG